jgi:heme/copper-type cytochrome/quinol oxidase subunit 3
MTGPRTLDVSDLPIDDVSSHDPLWWGQFTLALIEASMFFILVSMYFYIRLSYDVWPPPGVQIPPLALCTIARIPLLLSCLGSYFASEAAKKDDRRGIMRGLVLNLAPAQLFMILRGVSWWSFNFNWKTGAYGSIVWSLMWLHTVDAVADILFTVVLFVLIALGYTGPKQRIGVHVDSVLWYFIVLIWLPIYIVIFWGPRFAGAPQ